MSKITSDCCNWCKGTGTDPTNGHHYPCLDCRGTGFKHAEAGAELFEEQIEKAFVESGGNLYNDLEEEE